MVYKAFISYSHAADGKLAPALQLALEKFARRWYRLRAFRIFRDQTNLSVNPGLWSAIERSLKASEYFILLASPVAASSKWVQKEVSCWLMDRSAQTLLLVLTEGELGWDDESGDFDWQKTTALPRTLSRVYAEEPLFLDLRLQKSEEDLSLKNPIFADKVATLGATLHGRDKGDLIGEDVRQHRRFAMAAWTLGIILSALSVSLVLLYFYALSQRDTAQIQKDLAERRGFVSIAQALSAEAWRQKEEAHNDELALLLISQAFRFNKDYGDGSRLSQIDEALRRVLSTPYFGIELHSPDEFATIAVDFKGELLAVGTKDPKLAKVLLWDLVHRKRLTPLPSPKGNVHALDFSPLESRLAVGTDEGSVTIWNLSDHDSPRIECVVQGHSYKKIHSVSFAPSGRMLASGGDDKTVTIFTARTPCAVSHQFGPFQSILWSLDFSYDGKSVVAGFGDGSIRVLNVGQSEQDKNLVISDYGKVRAVAVSPRYIASASDASEGTVALWDLSKHSPGFQPKIITKNAGTVYSLAFSPSGDRLALGTAEGLLRIWELGKDTPNETILKSHEKLISSVAFSPNGKSLLSCSREKIRLWNASQPVAQPTIFRGSESADNVYAISISPDGSLLASADGSDETIRIWNISNPSSPMKVIYYGDDNSTSDVIAVVIDRNNRMVAASASDFLGDGNMIILSSLDEANKKFHITFTLSPVKSLSFSPHGDYLVTAGEGENHFRTWKLVSGKLTSPEDIGITSSVVSLCFDSRGKWLILGLQDGSVRLWNATGRQKSTSLLGRHKTPITSVVYVAPNRVASGAKDGSIRIWGLDNGKQIELVGQDKEVQSLGSDRSGKILASGLGDGSIRIWDLDHVDYPPIIIRTPWSDVNSVSVDPSGQWVAASGRSEAQGESEILSWLLTDALIRRSSAELWRNMSIQEWQRFVGTDLPRKKTIESLPYPEEGFN